MAGWQACHPQPLTWRATETEVMGPAAAPTRDLKLPRIYLRQAGPGPQTLTHRTGPRPPHAHRRTSPDSVWKGLRSFRVRRSLPGSGVLQSQATVVVVTQRPVGSGKRKPPLPVNRLTFPSQSELHPLPPVGPPPSSIPPCAAGSCGYLQGLSKIRVEEIRRVWIGLRARPGTTLPSRQRGVRRRLLESGMQNSARAVVMERC